MPRGALGVGHARHSTPRRTPDAASVAPMPSDRPARQPGLRLGRTPSEVEGLLREPAPRSSAFAVARARPGAASSGADRIVGRRRRRLDRLRGGRGAGRAGVPLAVIAAGTANDFATGDRAPGRPRGGLRARGDRRRAAALAGARPGRRAAVRQRRQRRALPRRRRAGARAQGTARRARLPARRGQGRAPPRAGPLPGRLRRRARCFDGEAWQVSVASTGAFGGGASLETDAGDGRLDVVVIEAGSRARLVKHAYGLRGRHASRTRRECLGTGAAIGSSCGSTGTRCLNVDGELVDAGELSRGRRRSTSRAERRRLRAVVG